MMNIEKFKLLRRIAKGGYGEILLAKSNVNTGNMLKNESVALKIISKLKERSIRTEVEVLRKVENIPFLSEAYGFFQDRTHVFIVLRYEKNGTIADMLYKHRIFTEEFARNLTVDVILGVQFLHRIKFLHGDLKPANILIDSNYRAVVSDFGLCRACGNGQRYKGIWGTEFYQTPEQLNEVNEWDEKVDIFAVGVMFMEMVTGRHPFIGNATREEDVIDNIGQMKYHIPQLLTPTAMSFVSMTVCPSVRRMTTDQVLEHSYIKPHIQPAATSFKPPNKEILSNDTTQPYYNHTSFLKNISGIHFVGPDWDGKVVADTQRVANVVPAIGSDSESDTDDEEDLLIRATIRKQLQPIEDRMRMLFEVVKKPKGYYVVCHCGAELKVTCQPRVTKNKYSVQPFSNHLKRHA